MHDLHHLLSNQLLLRCLGVASGLHLSGGLLGETNGEHSHDVAIHGLGLHEGLNKGVPFLDHVASMISCDVHTMEIGVAIKALDLIDLELQLSPGLLFLWVWSIAIVERNLDNTSFKTVEGLIQTCRLVTRHQSDNSFIETWGQNIVPLFFGEWMGPET